MISGETECSPLAEDFNRHAVKFKEIIGQQRSEETFSRIAQILLTNYTHHISPTGSLIRTCCRF